MVYAHHVLLDDRAFVKVGRYEVGGSANQFHAARVGLRIRVGTFESRKEGVVNVDDSALKLGHEFW